MRTYEALYIVSPEVEEDVVQTIAREFESLVTQQGGAIVRSEIWGRRKLAYPVKKHTEGYYVLLRYDANPEFTAKLEQRFKLHDHVIRFLVIYFDERTLRLETEQAARREAELRANASGARHRDDDDDDRPAVADPAPPAPGEAEAAAPAPEPVKAAAPAAEPAKPVAPEPEPAAAPEAATAPEPEPAAAPEAESEPATKSDES